MEDLVRTLLIPRLDQLEYEVKLLREVTWPVCQALLEDKNPLNMSAEKRKFFKSLYKDEAIELLEKKLKFIGEGGNNVIRDAELDSICLVIKD